MLRRVFIAVLFFLGLAQAALAERRVALVLATEEYKIIRKLENPVNDARAIEALLEGLGFEVWLETDRDLKRMRRALEDFQEDAAGADLALVFYAGHGVALDGVNYLLPTDADAASSERLAETSLPLDEVHAALTSIAPKAILLLDACRDDPFATGGSDEGRGAVPLAGDPPAAPPPVPGLGRMGSADGVVYSFAAAPGATASDGDGENSPFTAALVRHFGAKGVELKTALTLVQQDVYDRSRGKQSPYIESGLPDTIFISEQGDLPEREALLMKMADVTPEMRAEVEAASVAYDVPLATLYGSVLEGNFAELSEEELRRKLGEAAENYRQFQSELLKYVSDDPRVAELRTEAQEQLTLGSFKAARDLLTKAVEIDASARKGLKENFISRTLSEASTHVLNARAARTDLRYDLAIDDLTKAVELYAEVEADLPDTETRLAYNYALGDLALLEETAGNLYGALGAYLTQVEFAEAQLKEAPADYTWMRELFWAQSGAGSVLQQQGFLSDAEDAYLVAYEISAKQNADHPNDPGLLSDMYSVLAGLGDLRRDRSALSGALEAYQESLSYALSALDLDPVNVAFRRNVSHAYERVGDILFKMGSRSDARDAFDAALQVSKALFEEFPDDAAIKRDLSVRYETLGDAVRFEGDLDAAFAAYTESLRLREELLAKDPANTDLQRVTALMQQRLADIHKLMGDPGTALMLYESVRTTRMGLVALDPSNSVWAQDLTTTLERIGDVYMSEGEPEGALAIFTESANLLQAVLALDPGNLSARRSLGVSMLKVAQAVATMGDLEAGLQAHLDALAFRRETLNADPTVPLHVIDVYYALAETSYVQYGLGDLAAAEASMAEAVQLAMQAAETTPGDQSLRLDLADYARDLGSYRREAGDTAGALQMGQLGFDTALGLVAEAPDDPEVLVRVMRSGGQLGDMQLQAGDFAAALVGFQASVEAARSLADAAPGDPVAAGDYAATLYWVGVAKVALSDNAGARADLEVALALRQAGVALDPNDLQMQRDLAYVMQKLADTYYFENNLDQGRSFEEQALQILRRVDQREPGQVANLMDVVVGLDRVSTFYTDPKPYLAEAVSIMEGLQAAGQLPDAEIERLNHYRGVLGGN